MWSFFTQFRRRVRPLQLSDEDFSAYLVSLGIRIEKPFREQAWRCYECSRMQHGTELQVWIPDGARTADPLWSVVETNRRWFYNGSFSAWCLSCCRSFTPMSAAEMLRSGETPHDPIPTITLTVPPNVKE
jgi:hypothetical protein